MSKKPTPKENKKYTAEFKSEAIKLADRLSVAEAAEKLGGPVWVVKAQIHAGGRGKAGGVKVVKSIDDVKKEAARLLDSAHTIVSFTAGQRDGLQKGQAARRSLAFRAKRR